MRLLVVQVAGLSRSLVDACPHLRKALPEYLVELDPVFPALTCPAQATLRTALPPHEHGIVANGRFDRRTRSTDFWNQSARLVNGTRIWKEFRRRGGRVGMMFWQQSLGEEVDLVLSPAPVHKHGGGMVDDCYSLPRDLYTRICRGVGRRFRLHRYWGPLASDEATRWIAEATAFVLRTPQIRPDLLFTYLPHLDYALQRLGPSATQRLLPHLETLADALRTLTDAASDAGMDVLIWSDYTITPVSRPVFPNRVLRDHGLLDVRMVRGRAYHDPYVSRAFAVVDHQIAHVYVSEPRSLEPVRELLAGLDGVEQVLDHADMPHAESGDLILVAESDAWFAYPWWTDRREAPDYATHVDIHRKPGYDPCELFFGRFLPPSVSTDPTRVRGSHGRGDQAVPAAASFPLPGRDLRTTLDLARLLRRLLSSGE